MIGILGGTFDPFHNGHLHIANQVVTRLALEQLILMPCAIPVHRDPAQASAFHRCEMVRQAIASSADLQLSTLEIDRDGPSYSVDSLRELGQVYDQTLVLAMGLDVFNGFDRWRSPDEILQLAHLAICHRPGFSSEQQHFNQHLVEDVEALQRNRAGSILMLEVDAPQCSSSGVRMALDAGKMPADWLPPRVAAYINEHNLYRKTVD